MSTLASERLDSILALAAIEYAQRLNDEFLSAKPDFEISESTAQRIMRMIRKEKQRINRKKTWKIVKYILVACLIVATVAFSACMAISRIRQAFWKVNVERHDEYANIQFLPAETDVAAYSASASDNLRSLPDGSDLSPPRSIKEVNMPSYLLSGCTTEFYQSSVSLAINYFDEHGSFVCAYHQSVTETSTSVDIDQSDFTEITINEMDGVMVSYNDQPDMYCLIWQDRQYRYSIVGRFKDYNELIRLAESVEIK